MIAKEQMTDWMTAEDVAALWTKMSAERGYVHEYTPSAVARLAPKLDTYPLKKDRLGRVRLYLISRESALRVGETLRPWAGHPPKEDNSPLTNFHCGHCGKQLTEYEVQNMDDDVRTWAWCKDCKRADPAGWRSVYQNNWDKNRRAGLRAKLPPKPLVRSRKGQLKRTRTALEMGDPVTFTDDAGRQQVGTIVAVNVREVEGLYGILWNDEMVVRGAAGLRHAPQEEK